MCGIIGIVSNSPVAETIISGLKRMEYRGYDSSGIATSNTHGLERLRAQGKLENLEQLLARSPLDGMTGIGHTRWATHGVPSEANAHPHATYNVAVVHNGIIENFRALREELEKNGCHFTSQTDTEVVPQLITYYLQQGDSIHHAVMKTLSRLEGAFALGIIFKDNPELLIAARKGSPLAIGYGTNAMYLGSDAIALAPLTSQIAYLEDGDWAELTQERAQIFTMNGMEVTREIKTIHLSTDAVGKGDYPHYMLKEIFEQPEVIANTLSVYTTADDGQIHLPRLDFDLAALRKITIVGCGTSYYAGLVARYWLEQYAKIPVEIDIASEYRYREPLAAKGEMLLCISQSGETADTLAALRLAKSQGMHTLAIVNVAESTMAQEAGCHMLTYAGPEIGVASTKAFTTQLTTLACFTLAVARARGTLDDAEHCVLLQALMDTPVRVAEALGLSDKINLLAAQFKTTRDALYIGRGTSFAIALEGALKLKEISYIHAEAYAAGELKHGPIALIDAEVPVIVVAPDDPLFPKTLSNVQEAAARGGKIIMITDEHGAAETALPEAIILKLADTHPFIAPIIYTIPAQLLAYHVAVLRGTDIDQPRNLAKSVTVE